MTQQRLRKHSADAKRSFKKNRANQTPRIFLKLGTARPIHTGKKPLEKKDPNLSKRKNNSQQKTGSCQNVSETYLGFLPETEVLLQECEEKIKKMQLTHILFVFRKSIKQGRPIAGEYSLYPPGEN